MNKTKMGKDWRFPHGHRPPSVQCGGLFFYLFFLFFSFCFSFFFLFESISYMTA